MTQTRLVVATVPLLLALLAAGMAIHAWVGRKTRVRETYALWIFVATILMSAHVAISALTLMPWQLPFAWYEFVFGDRSSIQMDEPRPTDLILLVVTFALLYRYAAQLYRQWDGLRSIWHQRRFERGEVGLMLLDGVLESARVLARGRPVPVFRSGAGDAAVPMLETVRDISSWRDETRELLKLRSSSYEVEPENWHDAQGCWVGRNVDTKEPVFLLPLHEAPSRDVIRRLIAYAQKLEPARDATQMELIVAIDTDGSAPADVFDQHVRAITREELLDNLVNFADYRRAIIGRVESHHLPDSTLTLPDVFVPSRLARDEVSLGKAEPYLEAWLNDRSQRQLAMLGGYGQGKSTTALMFTYKLLSEPDWNKRARIPVLIELRGTSPRNLTPLQLLGAWAAQYSINAKALLKLHIAGRLILIFEGFDEMALIGDADMRLKHFKVLWQFCYERAKILITGRPNFFLDDAEMRMALGIHLPLLGRPYCDAVRLEPFTAAQIAQSLRAHPERVRDGITELVAQNERFRDLVSRPSLLHIVSILWEQERLYERIEQLDSAFIMELFVRHSYRRQGLKEFESPDFMALTTREREYFMQGVAVYMASKKLPNQIGTVQLNQLIDSLIEAAPTSLSEARNAMDAQVNQPLRDRVRSREHAVEHVRTDVRTCGLLVDDPAASGTFRFGHKSFMEYLVAATMADRILTDSPVSATLLRVTNGEIADISEIPVALEFLSEIVERGGLTRDTRVAPHRDQTKHQKDIALRLLRTLEGGRTTPWMIFERLQLFESALSASSMALPLGRRTLVRLFRPSSWPMLAVLTIAITSLLRALGAETWPQSGTHSTIPMMMMMIVAIMAMWFHYSTFLHRMHRRKVWEIWTVLCERLGIQNHVLHRIAGTYWFPWARRQRFAYSVTSQSTHAPGTDAA